MTALIQESSVRLDSKTRRKLQDQRRMKFRRAIEARAEDQRLAVELDELLFLNQLLDERQAQRRQQAPGQYLTH
ncbi:MAG: transcriptional regulator [Pseudomonas sp. PGPPP4]|uniref:PA3496 family putative envelope integrity protein n=1 Tax=Pseudomonas TaxID=286 RepID=UPI000BD7D8F7|nr:MULTISPECIES: transcriptional regulator [Pseudomonas]MCI1007741.1 transcriptional regulator [Pseudomonas oryzihabitans]OYT84389.1 MAG: transcriptional regulator [Pseudomonas sp. PGPPP4]